MKIKKISILLAIMMLFSIFNINIYNVRANDTADTLPKFIAIRKGSVMLDFADVGYGYTYAQQDTNYIYGYDVWVNQYTHYYIIIESNKNDTKTYDFVKSLPTTYISLAEPYDSSHLKTYNKLLYNYLKSKKLITSTTTTDGAVIENSNYAIDYVYADNMFKVFVAIESSTAHGSEFLNDVKTAATADENTIKSLKVPFADLTINENDTTIKTYKENFGKKFRSVFYRNDVYKDPNGQTLNAQYSSKTYTSVTNKYSTVANIASISDKIADRSLVLNIGPYEELEHTTSNKNITCKTAGTISVKFRTGKPNISTFNVTTMLNPNNHEKLTHKSTFTTCDKEWDEYDECSACKVKLNSKHHDATAHTYEENIVLEATCSQVGIKHLKCKKCNHEENVQIDKLEHSWDKGTVIVEPTNSSEGKKLFTCNICHTNKIESIPKTPTPTPEVLPEKVVPTPAITPTTEKQSQDIIDKIVYDYVKKLQTDKNGLFDGDIEYTFTSNGNKFKVNYNGDGKYKVSILLDGKWVNVPLYSTKAAQTSLYNYSIAKAQDGSFFVDVLKNKKLTIKKASIKSLKSKKKTKTTVIFNKQKDVNGYQIQYSTSKKFTKKTTKTKNISNKKNNCTLTKLKSKKTYYVKIRAYKKVNGKKVYGTWSKTKKVKIK